MENCMKVSQKMKSSTLYDPGTTLLGVNTKEMKSVSWTDICILMFIVALFTVTKCQSMNKLIKKVLYIDIDLIYI